MQTKVCTYRITKFSTFFVSFKMDVTGETSRTFGETTGPKLGYRIPLFSQPWMLARHVASKIQGSTMIIVMNNSQEAF
jgi:hypothetical protein